MQSECYIKKNQSRVETDISYLEENYGKIE